jgi:hypothetical protein
MYNLVAYNVLARGKDVSVPRNEAGKIYVNGRCKDR